jgi:membrane protein DedA with SNARE-associated domain
VDVAGFLQQIPPLAVYAIVGAVIGLESLGIPLPGEIVLVTAALMSSHHELAVNPVGVGTAAVIGAIVGDSIGYAIGRRFGMRLFDRLGERFPKHFGKAHVVFAERLFARWGVYAVFFGRFIAILRILAGPLAGALKMRYPQFLAANALGGLCWAGGTTELVYYGGKAAEHYLQQFSWIGLGVAAVLGLVAALLMRRGFQAEIKRIEEELEPEPGPTANA